MLPTATSSAITHRACVGALLLTAAMPAWTGCGRTAPAKPQPPTATTPSVDGPVTTPTTNETAMRDESPIAQAASGQNAIEPAANRSPYRFLLLGPTEPLVVEISVTIDDQPLEAYHAQRLELLLTQFDSDGDGQTSWEELIDHPIFASGALGMERPATDKRRLDLIEQNDLNRDKRVSGDEMSKLLSGEASSSQALTLRSSNEFRDTSVRESTLRRLLDEDGDGVLQEEETKNASVRLHTWDANDDEQLDLAELQSGNLIPSDLNAMISPVRQKVWAPDLLEPLSHRPAWDRIFSALQELYALGGRLELASLPAEVAASLAALDENKDGFVGRSEIEQWVTLPPDLEIRVAFAASSQHPPAIAMTWKRPGETLEHSLGGGVDRRETWLTHLIVRWECLDLAANDDSEARAAQALEQGDRDRNGYLEKTETPEDSPATVELWRADFDNNGKLYARELTEYFQLRQGIGQYLVRMQVGYQPDALLELLDQNGDQRLDVREIRGIAERLKILDRNHDDRVTIDEIDPVVRVNLVRGDMSAVGGFSRTSDRRPPAPSSDDRSAVWFRAMDANRDGMVSQREFLGNLDLFRKLDRNQDGCLEWNEASDTKSAPHQPDGDGVRSP